MSAAEHEVVLVGVGEMGGVFARAFLRHGRSVRPVRRGDDLATMAERVPGPELVLVTVAEDDLDAVLGSMPAGWAARLLLVQNELLPPIWEGHAIAHPTVAVVWFEKKPGRDVRVILSSPVGGPCRDLVVEALGAIGIPAHAVDETTLRSELVRKSLYVLTTNVAGLDTRGTVGGLWEAHRELALAVAGEILDIQEALLGHAVDRAGLVAGMAEAFAADPDHGTTGRSAPARLARALRHAAEHEIAVPVLADLAARHGLAPAS